MASGSSAVPASEAQRIMMLSVDKIVASRNRRGGVSLHRNLLVAGVLFRARDALLAAKSGTVFTSAKSENATSGTTSSVRSAGNAMLTEQKSSSFSSSTTSTSKSTAQSTECCGNRSTPQGTTLQQEAGQANDDVPMGVSISDSKENVPPLPSSSAKLDSLNAYADLSAHQPSRKRSYPVSTSPPITGDPVERKLVKTTESTEMDKLSRKRWASCKFNKIMAQTSFSSAAGRQTNSNWSTVNADHVPIVYASRVEMNAAACRTPTIGSTISPHCGSSSGLGITNVSPACVVQVV